MMKENLWTYLQACPAILLTVVLLPCRSTAQTNSSPKTLTLENAINYALDATLPIAPENACS